MPPFTLELVPITLAEANAFVLRHHRHHQAVLGAKFCLAVAQMRANDTGGIVGVAIVGRPVSRHLDDGWTLEVNRSCTVDTKNVNSMLYGAAWRVTRGLGYRRLITYTLLSESGASLRGAGWRVIAQRAARSWAADSRERPRVDQSAPQQRLLWAAR
jgi:hypothetical protein